MVCIIKEAINGGHLPLCFLNWKIAAGSQGQAQDE
jgi:hypothetical protein